MADLLPVASVTIANGVSAALLADRLIRAFALWYWELDRGGPFSRAGADRPYSDFLFPQMTDPANADPNWEPTFGDYLYVSFTNTTAFSPTDTMPMSRWAKLLMMSQSMIAIIMIAFVLAHAVNILK